MTGLPSSRGLVRELTLRDGYGATDVAHMSYQNDFGYGSFGMAFRPTPMVKRLLIANSVVFAITLLMPPRLVIDWMAFQPARIIFRPWAPLTYMFVHGGLYHLFFNMLMLFFFGRPIEERWGGREFLKFYLICGLGGGITELFVPAFFNRGCFGGCVRGYAGIRYELAPRSDLRLRDLPRRSAFSSRLHGGGRILKCRRKCGK